MEDETLACGTGSVAAAIIASLKHGTVPPVHIQTHGGEMLDVYFKSGPEGISNVFLEGEAKIVYEGLLKEEEL